MDHKTFTTEEIKELITLLTEANDTQSINTYSKSRIEKAINKLNK